MEALTPVFTVHELNEYVDLVLGHDPNLSNLTVDGELGGCKRHPSGHLYFTLKDETASVSCVMFRQYTQSLRFLPKDGMRVRLCGKAALYGRDGRFQLYATALQKLGEGDLYAAFLRYRDALQAKGWFDAASKVPIPKMPACVGVVTSPSGAALQDVRNVIARRFPTMMLAVYPTAVQGDGAAIEIAAAIDRAAAEHRCDVLIVGRGGGSIEDLWAFNEPPVAEAIHRCPIPVISAVGHETDFSISDFVADLRAPTPSAAAELAVPELAAIEARLSDCGTRMRTALHTGVQRKKERLALRWHDAVALRVQRRISDASQALDGTNARMDSALQRTLDGRRGTLSVLGERIAANGPRHTLARGFVLVTNEHGAPISRAQSIQKGDCLTLRFFDGSVTAVAQGKEQP